MKNGNVDLVHSAVKQGLSDPAAIATWLELDKQTVTNALKRLVDAKKVRRDGKGYVPNTAPALADSWK